MTGPPIMPDKREVSDIGLPLKSLEKVSDFRLPRGWLIGFSDSTLPLWPRAVRNSKSFRSSVWRHGAQAQPPADDEV